MTAPRRRPDPQRIPIFGRNMAPVGGQECPPHMTATLPGSVLNRQTTKDTKVHEGKSVR